MTSENLQRPEIGERTKNLWTGETPAQVSSEHKKINRNIAITTGFFGLLTAAAGAFTAYQMGGDHYAISVFTGYLTFENGVSTASFAKELIERNPQTKVTRSLAAFYESHKKSAAIKPLTKLYRKL